MRRLGPLTVACMLAWCAMAHAQANDPAAAFKKAQDLYKQDNLLAAEKPFLEATRSEVPRIRTEAYEHLIAIYIRVQRPDRALATAAAYEPWLIKTKDIGRLSILWLQRAECLAAMGYTDAALKEIDQVIQHKASGDDEKQAGYRLRARCHETLGQRKLAVQARQQLEQLLRDAESGSNLAPDRRLKLICAIGECRLESGDPAGALREMKKHEAKTDVASATNRDYLRLLAKVHADLKEPAHAERLLQQALDMHARIKGDGLTAGDLLTELAQVANDKDYRKQAATRYEALCPQRNKLVEASNVAAFLKLQALYQASKDDVTALALATAQADWTSLVEPRLDFARGSLHVRRGVYDAAAPHLRKVVDELEQQKPVHLIDLSRALYALAIVELEQKEQAKAQALAQRCLKLYQRLPADRMLADLYNLQGSLAAQKGDVTAALAAYSAGLAVCERLDGAGNAARSSLLLNLSLLHQMQGDLGKALHSCQEAYDLFKVTASPDDRKHAHYAAALANLYLTHGQIPRAAEYGDIIAEFARKHADMHPGIVQAGLFSHGLLLLAQRKFGDADRKLEQVLALQRKGGPPSLLPRTLNYLAVSADLQHRSSEADRYLREARKLQEPPAPAYPVTHFITLWQLAEVQARQNRLSEARVLLTEALQVVEDARRFAHQAPAQRAAFFAQFAPGFDRHIHVSLQLGDIEEALAVLLQTRSRALYDQMRAAKVDPRRHLEGKNPNLLAREKDALRRVRVIEASIRLDGGADQKQQKELDGARKEYAEIWSDIHNAIPVYRGLTQDKVSRQSIDALRQRLARSGSVMLVYHLGQERSQLFLVSAERVEVFPLEAPADIANGGVSPPRDFKLAAMPAVPALAKPTTAVPLTAASARTLVDNYRLILDPEHRFKPAAGLYIHAKVAGVPVGVKSVALPGAVFLPAAARARIRALDPKLLLVIPDGALHELPLEALVLEAGAKPRYVLDELPPIAYAPSLGVLTFLWDQPLAAPANDWRLLTVCDPEYSKASGLRRLPSTAEESDRIGKHFGKNVIRLKVKDATVEGVSKNIGGAHILHIAAHAGVDARSGNLLGGIALTPTSAEDDGRLVLSRIYSMGLQSCELAVLSACVTNVAPEQPLEAGATLASGFLAAGARRVVASHWHVEDAATARLMERFFKELTEDRAGGQSVRFARALQESRRSVRNEADRSSPFYWAPFVLIGPGD